MSGFGGIHLTHVCYLPNSIEMSLYSEGHLLMSRSILKFFNLRGVGRGVSYLSMYVLAKSEIKILGGRGVIF